MEHLKHFSLPISEPVLLYTVILIILLVIPIILNKTNIPSIVGLIVVGILIGPYGFNLIVKGDIIDLFSKVGLLYIMFLAGMELEFKEFKRNRAKAIFFGIFTFAIPFSASYYTANILFGLDITSSILIGIMISSNTLIALPVIFKLGITKSSAINTAISGTVINDTLVLVLLAYVSSMMGETGGDKSQLYFFLTSFVVFGFLMFWGLPKISKWFFRKIPADGATQFLFVFASFFAASFAAEIIGAEPIIGAFFAGLAINRQIPHTSALMNRINFVGNTLFIPVFLISVGMLVNVSIIFTGYKALYYSVILIIIAIATKYLAALITKLFFKQSSTEMNTIFAITSGRAAATLAVALVGKKAGLLDNDFFNAIVLLIMITSLFSSYYTEKFGKKLAIEEDKKDIDIKDITSDRVLVPIANPATVDKLIELAVLVRDPETKEAIFPLSVVNDDKNAEQKIAFNNKLFEDMQSNVSASEIEINGINKVDVSVPNSISNASKELMVSRIIMGWNSKSKELDKFFGSKLETILNTTNSEILVSKLPHPLNTTDKILVSVPRNAELEQGFRQWLKTINNISDQLSASVKYFGTHESFRSVALALKQMGYKEKPDWKESYEWPCFDCEKDSDDQFLYVVVNARPHSLSYDSNQWGLLYKMPKVLANHNVIILYPKQFEY